MPRPGIEPGSFRVAKIGDLGLNQVSCGPLRSCKRRVSVLILQRHVRNDANQNINAARTRTRIHLMNTPVSIAVFLRVISNHRSDIGFKHQFLARIGSYQGVWSDGVFSTTPTNRQFL